MLTIVLLSRLFSFIAPPEFDCNDAILSYRGEKGVKIQCTVSANPALEKHSVTYMEAHSKNASITIDSENPESGHIRYSFERVCIDFLY